MRHVMFGDRIANYFGARGKGTASGIQIAVADDNVRIYPVTKEGLGTGSTMIEIPRKDLPSVIFQLDQIAHERDELR